MGGGGGGLCADNDFILTVTAQHLRVTLEAFMKMKCVSQFDFYMFIAIYVHFSQMTLIIATTCIFHVQCPSIFGTC